MLCHNNIVWYNFIIIIIKVPTGLTCVQLFKNYIYIYSSKNILFYLHIFLVIKQKYQNMDVLYTVVFDSNNHIRTTTKYNNWSERLLSMVCTLLGLFWEISSLEFCYNRNISMSHWLSKSYVVNKSWFRRTLARHYYNIIRLKRDILENHFCNWKKICLKE